MTVGPQSALLDDGRRLHLQHGPIDLIIEAFGAQDKVQQAYQAAFTRFQSVLDELVEELSLLRTPVNQTSPKPDGEIALAMNQAVLPFAPRFITPMAAVAGGVADEILRSIRQIEGLQKIYVNNGGDIALCLALDCRDPFTIGVVSNPATGRLITKAKIGAGSKIGGIATSGWRGRSHSLGIADCVTVFAKTAALADAAATMIANEIDLPDCNKITRQPAAHLAPDSDLDDQLVTVAVSGLTKTEVSTALDAGEKSAQNWFQNNLFEAAFLGLNNQERIIGWQENLLENTATISSTLKTEHRSTHA